jgi:Flp pilus assembly protein TadG
LAIIILGALDVGQFVNVAQTVNQASREGARQAARHSVTNVSEVETAVHTCLSDAYPNMSVEDLSGAVTVNVRNAAGDTVPEGDLTTIETGSSLSVEVLFDYDSVRWATELPGLTTRSLGTTTQMRRE